jgi:hypothetical protein
VKVPSDEPFALGRRRAQAGESDAPVGRCRPRANGSSPMG